MEMLNTTAASRSKLTMANDTGFPILIAVHVPANAVAAQAGTTTANIHRG